MKKKLFILLLIVMGLDSTYGQILDKRYVDNWIIGTFPNSLIDSSTMYLINGFPFNCKSVNNELSRYKNEDIIVFDLIDKLQIDSLTSFKSRSSVIILTTIGKQSSKSIDSNFEKAKRRFLKRNIITTADIDTSLKEPVLIINGMQIFHKDCYNRINAIKITDILGINLIDKPVSKEIYGSNSINGLIMIKSR